MLNELKFVTCFCHCVGLNLLPGSKRKTVEDDSQDENEMLISDSSEYPQDIMQSKRRKHLYEDSNGQNLRGCVQTTVCGVEGSLSKGFEGYLYIGSPFQLHQNNRAS
jgi:hypothetical protein